MGAGGTYVPETMRASVILRPRALLPEDFTVRTEPVQVPEDGEALVRVAGSSVNPIDWKMFSLSFTKDHITYPHISGWDIAGTIVCMGHGAHNRLKAGDAVWGLTGLFTGGGYAEYVTVPLSKLALAPTSIPLVHAGVVPVVALTDLQAFHLAGAPSRRFDVVVILGGSAGTGHLAIQLAKWFGASKVVATCGPENLDFCRSQGADVAVDYKSKDWRDFVEPRSVDFVFDCVAIPGTGDKAIGTIKDNGWYIPVWHRSFASEEAMAARGNKVHQTMLSLSDTGPDYLDALKAIIDAGGMRVHVDQTYSLSEVGLAFNASRAGHVVGKLSVVPSPLHSESDAVQIEYM